ncbi:hypothetical protein CDAR_435331 [Caerostris darwini]|uniref:LAGLIDADG homing endonuclease n=1 Tax=Caerostris darwini TaxID=1538125 RepID=A0AAV4SID6_9ARAC|nr:hypothetical protein CDAR_435331 [Caerostris darwini]
MEEKKFPSTVCNKVSKDYTVCKLGESLDEWHYLVWFQGFEGVSNQLCRIASNRAFRGSSASLNRLFRSFASHSPISDIAGFGCWTGIRRKDICVIDHLGRPLGAWDLGNRLGNQQRGECYAVTLISGTCIRRSFVKHINANAYDTAVQDLLDQDKHFSNECSLTAVHGTFSGKFESSLFSFQVV